jgi:hypothetical protein
MYTSQSRVFPEFQLLCPKMIINGNCGFISALYANEGAVG